MDLEGGSVGPFAVSGGLMSGFGSSSDEDDEEEQDNEEDVNNEVSSYPLHKLSHRFFFGGGGASSGANGGPSEDYDEIFEDIDEIDFTHHLEVGAGMDAPESPEDTQMEEYDHNSARSESPEPGDNEGDSAAPVHGGEDVEAMNQEDKDLLDEYAEQHRQDDDICNQIAGLRRP